MTTILFDIETNGLLDEMTKVHCIAMMEPTDKGVTLYDSTTGFDQCLIRLANSDRIVAHNAIGFDVPALKKLFPGWEPKGQIIDTLSLSRALWNDIINSDYGRKKKGFPARLLGSHGLEAYGYRLGEFKGEYVKKDNAWAVYTPEMGEYCKQDVIVLKKLWDRVESNATPEMLELECEFAQLMWEQQQYGVGFNEEDAIKLMVTLRERKEQLTKELQEAFPPVFEPVSLGQTFTARGKSKNYPGLYKGVEFCKIKEVVFNPGSRQQIADRLIKKYGWTPEQHTEKGAIVINESVLGNLDFEEAKLLSEYLMLEKRLGQVADGNQAWLKLMKKGRIHGRVNSGGAISGRCTHSNPNLAQVPAVRAPYGGECRSLFIAGPGRKLVGCDASGLELRCLAHYMAAYDGGAYGKEILEGDIHSANQHAAGLPTRDQAKTLAYALIYGAGDAKLGTIVGGGMDDGRKLRARFMKNVPALKKLTEAVKKAVKERKYLKGLDGRRMRTRSDHSALNLLLQGAGALVMKRWLIEVMRRVDERGLDAHPVLNIHDEAQFSVHEDDAEEMARLCEECMPIAGEYFNFRIPIEGEAKIGDNWKDTH